VQFSQLGCKPTADKTLTEMSIIQADYLVVGAGATAMSFVDTLLSETDSDVIIAGSAISSGRDYRKMNFYLSSLSARPTNSGRADRGVYPS